MFCFNCQKEEMERHKWNGEVDMFICNKCGRRYWFNNKENRIMTDEEVNFIKNEFNS